MTISALERVLANHKSVKLVFVEKSQVQIRGLHSTLVKNVQILRILCKFGGICAKIGKNVQNHVQKLRILADPSLYSI